MLTSLRGPEGDLGRRLDSRPPSTASAPDTYYDVIQDLNTGGDVMWGGWGADWPCPSPSPRRCSTAAQPARSNGQDFGDFKTTRPTDGRPGRRSGEDLRVWRTRTRPSRRWTKYLGEVVAYIPLDVSRFYLMHGSKVAQLPRRPGDQQCLPRPRRDRREGWRRLIDLTEHRVRPCLSGRAASRPFPRATPRGGLDADL